MERLEIFSSIDRDQIYFCRIKNVKNLNNTAYIVQNYKSYLSHRSTDIKIKKYKIKHFVNFVNIRENCL